MNRELSSSIPFDWLRTLYRLTGGSFLGCHNSQINPDRQYSMKIKLHYFGRIIIRAGVVGIVCVARLI
jgi:hypothetical protein